jgi:hypothetical protein
MMKIIRELPTLVVTLAFAVPLSAQGIKDWSSSCCESFTLDKFHSPDGSGLLMESLEVEKDKEVAVGILHSYKYFLVPVVSNAGLPDRSNTYVEVTAYDKTRLYPLDRVSSEVPNELRPNSKHPSKAGFLATYLFFPYDGDAMQLTVVLSIGTSALRFPFARSPEHMWFTTPETLKNLAAAPQAPKPSVPAPSYTAPIQTQRAGSSTGCERTLRTHIDGDFNGWEGETVYEMDDGTIWKQSGYHYHYHYAYHPEVLIYKDEYGVCRIIVKGDDDDEEVSVRRIK